jgi:PAS domain S-box-containing protein
VGGVILATLVVLLSSDLSAQTRRLISDVSLIIGGLTGAVTCNYWRMRFTGRRRQAWAFFAAAGGLTALGNCFIFGVHLARQDDWYLVFSAPIFVLALSCGLLGLSRFSASPRRRTDLARMIFDCAVISGSLFLLTTFLFRDVLVTRDNHPLALLLPMVDVWVATYALLIYVRVGRSDRLVLGFLCGGSALYAVSDLAFIVLTAERPGFTYGTPVDAGWFAGYLLIGLAALHPAAARAPSTDPPIELSPIAGTVAMFILVVLGSASRLQGRQDSGPNLTLDVLWLVIILAVGARQLLLIIDNDKLRTGLELMVADRTTELRHAIKQSELLLDSVGEGIYGVDRAGLVTFVNPAGARTLGYAPKELIGKGAHSTFHALRDDGTPFPLENCYITQAIRDGTVTNVEEDSYVRADGTTFAVEVTATPLTGEDYVRGAVVVFRDITSRLEVDRLKNEFVSMVSHELRTPLTSIRGSLGLLAGGALGTLPAGALRMVALALDSCVRLTRLINDILDIERIESGTMPMVIGHHRADVLIEAATAQLQILAHEAEVTLLVTDDDGVVVADPDRVVQTLINLLDNAIKFSPRGTTVEVSSFAHGGLVEFRIRDQGRGIPADKLDSIFSRFEQVDSSDARDKGGSGLGLAISRSMVERLGGSIWAESTPGAGAVFRFTLPRSDRELESLSAPSREPQVVLE